MLMLALVNKLHIAIMFIAISQKISNCALYIEHVI